MKESTIKLIDEFFSENLQLKDLKPQIIKSIELIIEMAKADKKLLVCGNGGSAADSEHIAGEMLKSFMLKRTPPKELQDKLEAEFFEDGKEIGASIQMGVKCIPLTSFTALNTAFINDCKPDLLYAQLVNVLGSADDVLIAISTSGNSKNVVYACQMAKVKGIKVIALTGKDGGKLKELADVLINVPSNLVYKVQELHLPVYHQICLCVENELFGE